MKIITKPTVMVVGHSKFHPHPEYPIPGDGSTLTKLGAFAAKGCYDSYGLDGRLNEDNQRRIIEQAHGSVLEHMTVSLFIEGITRGCSLELNRHRHLAISQRSTRYTDEEEAALVLEPYYAELYRDFRKSDGHLLGEYSRWEKTLIDDHLRVARKAFAAYADEVFALEKLNPNGLTGTALRKWARGKARNILPHGLETRATYTGNLRAWRHIIETRSSRHAEAEIRRLTAEIFTALVGVAPLYFEDYQIEVVDGFPEYTTPHPKV